MASKVARRAAGPAVKGRSMLWLQGMACGAVLTFATPAAMLAAGLLAPALLALAADRRPGRPILRAVLLYGCAVALAPLWHLCLSGDTMDTALVMVSDMTTLATAWLAAAVGWALCEILPCHPADCDQVHRVGARADLGSRAQAYPRRME